MIQKPELLSWLIAAWWLFVALRDCTNAKSPRYGNVPSILLALIAAGMLVWLGFLFFLETRAHVPIALIGFGVSFVLWIVASLAGGRIQ